MPAKVGDGSATNRMLGIGQVHMIKRACTASKSNAGADDIVHIFFSRWSVNRGKSERSLAYRRQATYMMSQKSVWFAS